MASIHSCLDRWSSEQISKGTPVFPQVTSKQYILLPLSGMLLTSVLPLSTSWPWEWGRERGRERGGRRERKGIKTDDDKLLASLLLPFHKILTTTCQWSTCTWARNNTFTNIATVTYVQQTASMLYSKFQSNAGVVILVDSHCNLQGYTAAELTVVCNYTTLCSYWVHTHTHTHNLRHLPTSV